MVKLIAPCPCITSARRKLRIMSLPSTFRASFFFLYLSYHAEALSQPFFANSSRFFLHLAQYAQHYAFCLAFLIFGYIVNHKMPTQTADIVHSFSLDFDYDSKVFCGFTFLGDPDIREYDGFEMVQKWSNPFRHVYVNDAEHSVFTYCEGIINLIQFHTEAEYEKYLAECAEFYHDK